MPPKTASINIDNLRTSEKNKINDEIRLLTNYNANDSRNLSQYRGIANDDYSKRQVEKLTLAISERNEKINKLEDRLVKLSSGEIDDELIATIKKTTNEVKRKNDEHLAKIERIRREEKEDEEFGKKRYNIERTINYEASGRMFNGPYKHFERATETLPEYMKNELANMPNNHAYVWKSVYFFGEKEPRGMSQATQNFKGYKRIERWDKDFTYIYEKPGRNPEKLISKTPRRKVKD